MYQRPFEDVTSADEDALNKAKDLERNNKKPLHKIRLTNGTLVYSTRQLAVEDWKRYESKSKITLKQ